MWVRVRAYLVKLAADRGGSFMVEFVMALPVLTFMVMGLVDLGRYSLQKSALLQGAREGAQYGSFAPNNLSDINTTAQNATGLTGATATSEVFCECTPLGAHVTCGTTCTGGSAAKKYVAVTTTKSFSKMLPSFGSWSLPSSVTATVTMICP